MKVDRLRSYIGILICVFGFQLSSFGQTKTGMRIGYNRSKENVKSRGSSINSQGVGSWMFGLFATSSFSETIDNQIAINVSSYGGEFDDGNQISRLTYVSIPILLKFSLDENSSILAGPQLGFLAKAKLKTPFEIIDIKELYKQHNWSFLIGYEVKLLKGTGFGLRYIYGLTNIDYSSDDLSSKINSFQIYLLLDF